MKKVIVSLIMFFAAGLTIYTVGFWEPSNDSGSTKEKSEQVSDSSGESELDKSKVQNGFNENKLDAQTVVNKNSIFKMEVEKIAESLSKESSGKIQNILKNLSTTDMCKVEEYARESDREEGTRKILSLLSKRLSTENYGEIKEILKPFIDFGIIAEKV